MISTHFVCRRTADDLNTFAASASESFRIDGVQYIAVGSEQSYMTQDQCLSMYTDSTGSHATECQYLLSAGFASSAVANASQCAPTCGNPTSITNYITETVIYTVGPATTVVNADGTTTNIAPPQLVEVQRIPSLGVSHLHFFRQIEPATQSSYEACFQGNSSFCYHPANATVRNFLVISNANSSCEHNWMTNKLNPRDPQRGAKIYIWDADTMQFTYFSSISGCKIVSVHDFTTQCQPMSFDELNVPACASYLAVEEDCTEDLAFKHQQNINALNISMKISFHKWNPSSQSFAHCQPYEDPGDMRNAIESICFQDPDPQRSPSLVAGGDTHAYDFPDILPTNLVRGVDFTEDGTGYYPQLNPSKMKALDFGVPMAEKDIFSVNSSFQIPIADIDQEPRTLYYVNGRKHYEVVFSVAIDAKNGPQVFALEALMPRDPVCSSGHPTTPRRRFFQFIQQIPVTDASGGRDVQSFERASLSGITGTYFVFPELINRDTSGRSNYNSLTSSVYTTTQVCNEYTQYTFTEATFVRNLPNGGTLSPAFDASNNPGDTKFCPYSLKPNHFEAWESFYNYYNPVSPCKGKVAATDGSSALFQQNYYNEPPPSALLHYGPFPPTGPYVYSRAANNTVLLNTHGYAQEDYAFLHQTRDNVMTKLQDLPTYGATSATLLTVCGGVLFLLFGQSGYSISASPPSKGVLYVWNDRYAIDAHGNCNAAGALTAWQNANNDILRVQLGCFEPVTLSVPINNGAASSIQLFQSGSFLFALTLNHGAFLNNTINPGACIHQSALVTNQTVFGVTSTLWTNDLSVNGGLQCQQYISSSKSSLSNSASGASSTNITVNGMLSPSIIQQLRGTFVDLTSNQTINGTKTFVGDGIVASRAVVQNTLHVGGDVTLDGTLHATDIVTTGLIDGIDLNVFLEETNQQLFQGGAGLAALEARICNATQSPTCWCVAQTFATSCFPKASLNFDGFAILEARFASYLNNSLAKAKIAANISSVVAFPLQHKFIAVLQSCSHTPLNVSLINTTAYTDSCLCQDSPHPALPTTTALQPVTIFLHNVTCDVMDLARLETLRLAIADGLSQFGTRLADVYFTSYTCKPTASPPPGLKLTLIVSSSTVSQAMLISSLLTRTTWTNIYDVFIMSVASTCFPSNNFSIEYLPNEFVPADSTQGSGEDGF